MRKHVNAYDEVIHDRAKTAEKLRKQMKRETGAEIKAVKDLVSRGRTDLRGYLASLEKKLEKLS